MKEVKLFEKRELGFRVRTILNLDDSISVNAEDTAIGYGWTQEKNGKTYVKWERLNSFCRELGFPQKWGKMITFPKACFTC